MLRPGKIKKVRVRIDRLLVERGLVASRERAQAVVLAGEVLVNNQKVEKAGTSVEHDAEIRLLGGDLKYVSRGGLKLEAALERWKIDLQERTCLDVGASTGGFTDCMLQRGAKRVIAVDTGYGQIAGRLRSDARVRLLERTNARYLKREDLDQVAGGEAITFAALDVSFISVTLILPAVVAAVFGGPTSHPRELVVLIKPQFEVGKALVGKGGIVRDPQAHLAAIETVEAAVAGLGGRKLDIMESPIRGREGNREFLLRAEFK
jgi:23S rRNA (cytidine1920-2'-O)/16S rRNA (cytidine1409-2'-O)-methyltransferase